MLYESQCIKQLFITTMLKIQINNTIILCTVKTDCLNKYQIYKYVHKTGNLSD